MAKASVKQQVRDRDGMCVDCEITAAEHMAKYQDQLDVHRLVKGSKYTLQGCVALCRQCHARRHRKTCVPPVKKSSSPLTVTLVAGVSPELRDLVFEIATKENTTVNRVVARLLAKQLKRPDLADIPFRSKIRRHKDAWGRLVQGIAAS